MKICPNCGAQLDDQAAFCVTCGIRLPVNAAPAQPAPPVQPAQQQYQNPNGQQYQQPYQQQQYATAPAAPVVSEYDHTEEFDAKDVSDNKAYAMLVYLMGTIGIIIALLAGKDSGYVQFHVRQGIKLTIVEMLATIIGVVLAFTIIVPIAAGVLAIVLLVARIIAFFDICKGRAREPIIVRKLKFLK